MCWVSPGRMFCHQYTRYARPLPHTHTHAQQRHICWHHHFVFPSKFATACANAACHGSCVYIRILGNHTQPRWSTYEIMFGSQRRKVWITHFMTWSRALYIMCRTLCNVYMTFWWWLHCSVAHDCSASVLYDVQFVSFLCNLDSGLLFPVLVGQHGQMRFTQMQLCLKMNKGIIV